MKIREKVFEVLPMQSFQSRNGDTLYSRDLVVETQEQYPKKIALTFKGANCKLLDVIHPGDTVEVTFDISSHKSNERYFTTLTAWKLDIIESKSVFPVQPDDPQAPAPDAANPTDGNVIYP